MRRHDEPRLSRLQPREVAEGAHPFRTSGEIQQQHVAAFDGSLHAWNQHEPAVGGIFGEAFHVELPFVQGDRERVIPEGCGTIDQLQCGMRNPVDRVVGTMAMELNLQHCIDSL